MLQVIKFKEILIHVLSLSLLPPLNACKHLANGQFLLILGREGRQRLPLGSVQRKEGASKIVRSQFHQHRNIHRWTICERELCFSWSTNKAKSNIILLYFQNKRCYCQFQDCTRVLILDHEYLWFYFTLDYWNRLEVLGIWIAAGSLIDLSKCVVQWILTFTHSMLDFSFELWICTICLLEKLANA